jgi:hypothetical protein
LRLASPDSIKNRRQAMDTALQERLHLALLSQRRAFDA